MEQNTAIKTETATFASGCFWSKEYFFSRVEGVLSTKVGFTGGHEDNLSYQEVCTKTTGHAEAVEITFDPVGSLHCFMMTYDGYKLLPPT